MKEGKIVKRIFMLSSHPLFCEGIENLLRCDAELEFIGREADVNKGINRIKDLQPDVVILDNGSPGYDTLLASLILQRLVGTEVIGLNLGENALYYRGEQSTMWKPDDLRQVIFTTRTAPSLA